MKNLKQHNNHIWILLGIGFIIRLVAYFNGTAPADAGLLRVLTLACDLGIGYVVYLLAQQVPTPTTETSGDEEQPIDDDAPNPKRGSIWPIILSALWLLNPASFITSSSIGLIEPLAVLLIMLALVFVRTKIYSVVLVLMLPIAFQLRVWLDGGPGSGSVSAFNFFALIGSGLGYPLDRLFIGFTYYVWGGVLTLIIVVGTAIILYNDFQAGGKNYFLIIGAYFVLLFMFSIGMYAGALFPGLAFLLLHFIERRDGRVLGLYFAFSVTLLINLFQMSGFGEYGFHFSRDFMILASLANMALSVVLVMILVKSAWADYAAHVAPGQVSMGLPAKHYIWILLAAGLLVRVLSVVHINFGFGFDIWLFREWGISIFEDGFASYYANPREFPMVDYPPVYLYVLYILAAIRAFFDVDRYGILYRCMLFLPAMLCDLGIGYVLHRRAEKTQQQYSRPNIPAIFAAFWIFSPAVILISSMWGQVESVFMMVLILSLLLLREKKLFPAYLLYGVAILTKPQSLFVAPVYLFSAIDYLQGAKFTLRAVLRLGLYILAAMALMILIFLPFVPNWYSDPRNFFTTLQVFQGGFGARPYATINAYNFHYLFGGNWRPIRYGIAGVPVSVIGMIVIGTLIVGAIAGLLVDRKRGGQNFYLICAGLFALLYVFAFRMLDRYLFPALPLLLLHAIEKRDKRSMCLYIGFSTTYFFNCYEMLRWAHQGESRYDVVRATAIGNTILGCFLFFVIISSLWGKIKDRWTSQASRV